MTLDEQIKAYETAQRAALALWRYHTEYLAGLVLKGIDIKQLEEYQKYLIAARDLHAINVHLGRLRGRQWLH